MSAIKAFSDKILLAPSLGWEGGRVFDNDVMETTARTYDDPARGVQFTDQAKKILGEKGFKALRDAVANPSSVAAFDIKTAKEQVAARTFLRTVIKNTRPVSAAAKMLGIGKERTLDNMVTAFAARVGAGGGRINAKYDLLLYGDPVQAMAASSTPPPALDVVLANVHFDDLAPSHIAGVVEANRATNRALIKQEFERLASHPDIAPLIACFAAIVQREKGSIFIGSTHAFSKGTPAGDGRAHTDGFYNKHHSVFVEDLVNLNHKITSHYAGTLVHEMAHMVFSRTLFKDGDPAGNAEEAQLLDEALAKDRAHRQPMDYEQLPHQQRQMYGKLVHDLEQSPHYFRAMFGKPADFNPQNPQHRMMMRTEAIVRPLQVLATGASHADIEAVAPNLWQYLQTRSLPMFQAYIKAAQRDGLLAR